MAGARPETGSPYSPAVRFLLCRMHRLAQWEFDDLSAPYWRLYWTDRAGALVRLSGREVPLVPARFTLIPPETPFAARLRRSVTQFYLHFLAGPPYDAVPAGFFRLPAPAAMVGAVREAAALMGPGGAEAPPRLVLLGHMLACWALSRIPPGAVPPVRRDERVAAALRLMDSRPAAPVTNAELARAAGMSTNAFIRLFSKVTGQSPQARLTATRIERACLLLHGSTAGIKEIAEQTGFCDRYHFSRVFKRLRGVGPAEFRRLLP
jgi:AraC-like DNA-binding protein